MSSYSDDLKAMSRGPMKAEERLERCVHHLVWGDTDQFSVGANVKTCEATILAREAIALLREMRNAADWAVETNDTTRLFSMLNKADKFLDGAE